MLYDHIKILHILSATAVITSMFYSGYLWKQFTTANLDILHRIQKQTWLIIIPFAIIQLITGFTMLNLKHEAITQLWIKGSVFAFIIMLASWIAFIYLLLSAPHSKRKQLGMLLICAVALLSMIFFMANKV